MLRPIYPPFWAAMSRSEDGLIYIPKRIRSDRYGEVVRLWRDHLTGPLDCGPNWMFAYHGPHSVWTDALLSKMIDNPDMLPRPWVYPPDSAHALLRLLPAEEFAIMYPGVSQLCDISPWSTFVERERSWAQILRKMGVEVIEGDLACLTPIRHQFAFIDVTRTATSMEAARLVRLSSGWAERAIYVLSSSMESPEPYLIKRRKRTKVTCNAVPTFEDDGATFTYLWGVEL